MGRACPAERQLTKAPGGQCSAFPVAPRGLGLFPDSQFGGCSLTPCLYSAFWF